MDLYIEDMSGANRLDLFRSDSEYAWPVAWHAGKLVLAVGPAFSQQGLWDNPYAATSFHVVDPATAVRTATIGGPDYISGCEVSGVLTPAGTACYHRTAVAGMGGEFWLLDWTGTRSPIRIGTESGGTASLNPGQPQVVAALDLGATALQILTPGGKLSVSLPGSPDSWPCWIDDRHVLVGAVEDRQFQPVIADSSSGGLLLVQARGFCAAVLGGPAEVH